MKIIGLLVILLGWIIPIVALSMTQSTTARMIVCVLGLAISLFGILVMLNKAHLKEAIWKA